MDGIDGVSRGVDMETVLKLAASSPDRDDKTRAKPEPTDEQPAGTAQARQTPEATAGTDASLTGKGGALNDTV